MYLDEPTAPKAILTFTLIHHINIGRIYIPHLPILDAFQGDPLPRRCWVDEHAEFDHDIPDAQSCDVGV